MSSLRGGIALTGEETDELLSSCWLLRIATHGPGDRINLTPLWFAWVDGSIYAYCRGQKVTNLRRDPRVTVLVDRNERFPELQGVMIEGTATVLENFDAEDRDPGLAKAHDVMGEKYAGGRGAGRSRAVVRRAAGTAHRWVRIEPTRVVSWDNTKLNREGG